MKKRNNDFGLSSEEVIAEYMKTYDSHHKHRHHHSKHGISESKSHSENGSSHSHHHKHSEPEKENKNNKKKMPLILRILIIVVTVLLVIALVGAAAVLIMQRQGMNEINKKKENVTLVTPDDVISYDESGKTVEYKGQRYVYNDNIITAAFLGIDDKGFGVSETDDYGTAGQADTIMVLAYDTEKGSVSIITVPRDSMVDVDIYSASGDFARTEKMQICLSFAYGNGKETSCENVIKSLERVLLGIPIDSYFSLRVRGVDDLNAAVGGIELTSLETFGQFVKGQKIHLTGSAARYYCTGRDTSKIDSDSNRRERQIQYIKAYASKVIALARDDIGVITRLYNTATQYTVTDIKLSSAVYIATQILSTSAKIDKITSLQGEYINSETYPQFILNDDLVYETILDVFYEKVN